MLSGLGKHFNASQPKAWLNGTVVSRTSLWGKGERNHLAPASTWPEVSCKVKAARLKS